MSSIINMTYEKLGALLSANKKLEQSRKEKARKIREILDNMSPGNGVFVLPKDFEYYDTSDIQASYNVDIPKKSLKLKGIRCGACGTLPDQWHLFCVQCGVKL